MTTAGRVRRLLDDAGLDVNAVKVTNGGDRVRLIETGGGQRALDFAADVLTVYGFTVHLGAEPWYRTVTKEN